MAFNVQAFRSGGLKYGGARPSLFEVTMTVPGALGATVAVDKIKFLVRAAQIPAATIDPVEVPYFGRKIKLAGDRTFADWTVTVLNDEDFALRSMFENWSNHMNSHVGNVSKLKPNGTDGYKAEASVIQYGRYAAEEGAESLIIRKYNFVGMFPTTIDAIALDWDNTNAIETFDVTFSYDWWEPENISSYSELSKINVGGGSQQSTSKPPTGGP